MNLTFNNEKWDYWATVISAIIELSKADITESIQLILDARALSVLSALKLLRERFDSPVPLELLVGIAPSDVAILLLIINNYYGKTALTYSNEGLQLSKEVAA